MEDELVASGRYVRLEAATGGSGVVIGFVERPDGSLVIAGGSDAAWPRRLRDEPRVRATIGTRTFTADATELDGADHAAAIRDLILRYGTPAERLGSGPAFVLRPVGVEPSDASRRSR
jgi:hypothetical protein